MQPGEQVGRLGGGGGERGVGVGREVTSQTDLELTLSSISHSRALTSPLHLSIPVGKAHARAAPT